MTACPDVSRRLYTSKSAGNQELIKFYMKQSAEQTRSIEKMLRVCYSIDIAAERIPEDID